MRTLMLLVVLVVLGGATYVWLQGEQSVPAPIASTDSIDAAGGGGEVAVSSSPSESAASPRNVAAANEREDVAATGGLIGRLLQQGEPLAGVEVIACRGSSSKAEELGRVRTSLDGTFRFTNLKERFWLAARGEHVPHHWQSRWMQPRDGIGDLEVLPPATIVGVVRDSNGAPIVGAKLTREISSYRRVVIGEHVELTATSDERGQFRFARVAKGDASIRRQCKGYQLEPDHRVEVQVGVDVTTEIVLREGIGHSNSGSDHPNPTTPQSHPAVTPSTDLLPSQPPGHSARKPTS